VTSFTSYQAGPSIVNRLVENFAQTSRTDVVDSITMKTLRWFIALVPVVLGVLGFAFAPRPYNVVAQTEPTAQTPAGKSSDAPKVRLEFNGASSCAARACHGGLVDPKEDTASRNAFSRWIMKDRHTEAYTDLSNDLAKSISRNLKATVPANEDVRCLACHTIPAIADITKFPKEQHRDVRRIQEQGISCEACHGPSAGWLGPHTVWSSPTESTEKRHDLYDKTGMVWLNSVPERVKMCAGCHVGAIDPAGTIPAREVDHDLIAAGHPRLTFEYNIYLKAMPPHWIESGRENRGPPKTRTITPLERWQVGQRECAKAALELLKQRAKRSTTPRLAPELSESDCFACHHDLKQESWRRTQTLEPGRKLGNAPWNRWAWSLPVRTWTGTEQASLPMFRMMATLAPKTEDLIPAIEKLETAIGESTDTLLSPGPLDENTLNRMTWDDAAQLYMAMIALNDEREGAVDKEDLARVRKALMMPKGMNSPAKYRFPDFPIPSELFGKKWVK